MGTVTLVGSYTDLDIPTPQEINAVVANWTLNQ